MSLPELLPVGVALVVAVFAAAGAMPRRTGVAGALDFGVVMVAVAGLFVLLDAHFLALMQIVTQLSIAVVLLLFVMILGGGRDADARPASFTPARIAQITLAGALGLGFASLLKGVLPELSSLALAPPEGYGSAEMLARELFHDYGLLAIGAGFLLLAALVGAGVVSGRRLD